ncbi:MAG: alpha/beta hydrolase [Clostridia bacterium]|nr:alpha/beta hydrolase [Clostridia bacterium]
MRENAMRKQAERMVHSTLHPDFKSEEEGLRNAFRYGDFTRADYAGMEETVSVLSTPERELRYHTMRCPAGYRKDDGIPRVIVMSHGFTSNLRTMLRYSRIYFELGYDTVLYSQRGHSEAPGLLCTMGRDESKDLTALIRHLREELGPDACLGVHGESMGAATALLALPDAASDLDFAVCDCGYSDFGEMARRSAEHTPFPTEELFSLADDLSAEAGVRFSSIRPVDRVRKTLDWFPLYLIHGGSDDVVPSSMAMELYRAKSGKHDLTVYPLARHARSQTRYKKHYKANIHMFLTNEVEDRNGRIVRREAP